MLEQVVLALEPLGALDAVPAAQRGQVFGRLGCFELRQVLDRVKVGVDLVQISRYLVSTTFISNPPRS